MIIGKKLLKGILLSAAMFLYTGAYAQDIQVTGKVIDSKDNSPMIGVTVVVKGTTVGTITDIDGNYSIKSPVNGTLVFSFLGYKTIEVAVSGQAKIDLALGEDTQQIDEVIVIGYGTQKKSEKTGAVAHVKATEMNQGVLTDAIQGLQSKASGVMINKRGGDPNAGFSIKIRGASSLTASTQPLIVVDGIPGADLSTVAPEDVESYNILKDASAAAIYGSRGANGVIIITTKRGSGKDNNQIEVNSYVSTEFVAKRLDLLSAKQVRDYVAENGLSFVDGGANVDWQDEIYRTGRSQNYSVSFSGGDNLNAYRASFTHSDFKGVVIGSDRAKTVGRINFDKNAFNEKLKIQAGLSGAFEKSNVISYSGWGANDILYQAFQRNPTDPVKVDGKLYDTQRNFSYYNPVKLVDDIDNSSDKKQFNGYFKADLEFIPGFFAGVNTTYTRDDGEGYYFEPSTAKMSTTPGYGSRSYFNSTSKVIETTLRFEKTISSHSFDAITGYSFQEDFKNGFGVNASRPFSNYLGANNLGMFQSVTKDNIYSYKESDRLISFFGRAKYNYDSKYFLTLAIRRDGSSRFGENNKWGWFPSAQAMWSITNEDFMQNIMYLNSLKFRVSYGKTGRLPHTNYMGIYWYKPDGTAINPETGEITTSMRFAYEANPDLKWELNTELNFGLDFGLFKDRISGSIEYFTKQNTDLLGEYPVPVPPNRAERIWANVGRIDVKGIELFIQTFPIQKTNFEWKTSIVFSSYKQITKKLSDPSKGLYWSNLKLGYLSGPGLVGDRNYTQILQIGDQIGSWYLPEYAGLSADGKFLFYTAAGGVTRDLLMAETRIVGNAQPDFEIGWSNYFTIYKNFDLNMNIRAIYGYEVFNTTKLIFGNPIWLPNINVLESALDEKARGLNDSPKASSYYLEDASFIRIDNISLGYNFKKIPGIKNLRVYFASNNLLTITKYSGIDPEINYDGLSFGLDQFNVYPKSRTFTFGVNVSL